MFLLQSLRRGHLAGLALVFIALIGSRAANAQRVAQLANGFEWKGKCTAPEDEYLPAFSVREVTQRPRLDSVTRLRWQLQHKCWANAIKTYLRNYQRPLPTWVVYIDSHGIVTQGLVSKGGPGLLEESDTSSVLVNQRSIWALIFSDRPLQITPEAAAAEKLASRTASTADFNKAASSSGGPVFREFDSLAIVRARNATEKAVADSGKAKAAADNAKQAVEAAQRAVHSAPPSRRAEAERNLKLAEHNSDDANTALAAARKAVAAALDTVSKTELKKSADSLMAIASVAAANDDLNAKRAATIAIDTSDLVFARRTVIHAQDPLITTVIKGLLSKFGVAGPDPSTLPDSTRVLRLLQVVANSCGENRSTVGGAPATLVEHPPGCVEDSMYVALSHFSLVTNASVELSAAPFVGKKFAPGDSAPQLQRVYVNVANAQRHNFELGALAAITHGTAIQDIDSAGNIKSTQAKTAVNGYITFHVNVPFLWIPLGYRENWRRAPFGAFFGTNVLSGTVGDQMVAGLSLGHLFGDAGLSVGRAWVPEQISQDGHIVNRHTPRFLIGTDLRF